MLFESEQRDVDALATLAERRAAGDPPLNPYTATLVEGVVAVRPDLDALIAAASPDWPVDRMPAVDRTVLRLATWELVHGDVPSAVAIDEAVELCRQLSTDESPGFVNGVLARILADQTAVDAAPVADTATSADVDTS